MAYPFLKRNLPDLDTERIEPLQSKRLAVTLFVLTYGLWFLTCAIALVIAATDALPASRQVLLVTQILE